MLERRYHMVRLVPGHATFHTKLIECGDAHPNPAPETSRPIINWILGVVIEFGML